MSPALSENLRYLVFMAYQIQITADAERQLRGLTARQQRLVEDAVVAKLTNQPTVPTRAIKKMRPNPLVQYELRVAELRYCTM